MGEFTKRAGCRGRRHGGSDARLVLGQRVVLSGDPGATTPMRREGNSPIIRSLTIPSFARRAGGDLRTPRITGFCPLLTMGWKPDLRQTVTREELATAGRSPCAYVC